MTKELIRYDYSYMKPSGSGKAAPYDLKGLSAAFREIRKQAEDGKIGFLRIPYLKDDVRQVQELADSIRHKYRTLIVVGIGGSDLGARTIIQSLSDSRNQGMEIRFIGANTDPEEISDLLETVDLKKSVINIVSKSGGTLEPMSTFLVLRDRLIKTVGKDQHRKQVVVTTDPESGTLRAIAEKEGYRTLPVPQSIGGRFSALTSVGLFPAACAGIQISGLIRGSKSVFDQFLSGRSVKENGPLMFAGLQHHAYISGHGRMAVLMPYSSQLEPFGKWFVQLWAESLGKEHDRQGIVVRHGQTPIAALGATDQHSQVQLFEEGPLDKTVTFIDVERRSRDLVVPNPYPDVADIAYMAGHKFSRIIRHERQATAESLYRHGRPNGTIFLGKVTPETVGGLMAFFMLSVAVMGELMDIDVYNQPGVESGKKIIYKLMGRPGY